MNDKTKELYEKMRDASGYLPGNWRVTADDSWVVLEGPSVSLTAGISKPFSYRAERFYVQHHSELMRQYKPLNEAAPSITVSADKTAQQIAADIKRHLLPKALELEEKMAAMKNANDERERREQEIKDAVLAVVPSARKLWNGELSASKPIDNIKVVYSDTLKLTLEYGYADLQRALAVLRFVQEGAAL